MEKIETGGSAPDKHILLPSHKLIPSIKMGFDAWIQVKIYFKKGRPFFLRDDGKAIEEVYDLTQIPEIPERFHEFESLRGHSWRALLESNPDMEGMYDSEATQILIPSIHPDYKTMTEHESYCEEDFTEEDIQKFKEFCDWTRGTKLEFYYIMCW